MATPEKKLANQELAGHSHLELDATVPTVARAFAIFDQFLN